MKKLIYFIGFLLSMILLAILIVEIIDIRIGYTPKLILFNPIFEYNTIYWIFGIQLLISIFGLGNLINKL